MNKRRRAYKKKSIPTRGKAKKDIYNKTKKLVNRANRRLNSLERHTKLGTYASKILKNKLTSSKLKAFKNGRVRINKNLTTTQLIAINKVVHNFLNSLTSTYTGIKQVRENNIEALAEEFDIQDSTLNRNDYADIYELFGTSEFKDLSVNIQSSDIVALLADTLEYKYGENEFIERLGIFINGNDIDIRNKAINLYNKLMERRR